MRQAYVDGLTTILYFILTCIGMGVLYKLHIKFTIDKWYDDDKLGDVLSFPMFIAALVIGCIFIVSFVGLMMSILGIETDIECCKWV